MKNLLLVVVGGLLASSFAMACPDAQADHSARSVNPKTQIVASLNSTVIRPYQGGSQNSSGVDGVYSSVPKKPTSTQQN